jgi:hypothetical protein
MARREVPALLAYFGYWGQERKTFAQFLSFTGFDPSATSARNF